MANNEPAILDYNPEEDAYHLELHRGDWAGQRWDVQLSACDNPLCHCQEVHLQCIPLRTDEEEGGGPDENEVAFPLNAVARTSMDVDDGSDAVPPLAAAVAAELTAADWDVLEDFLVAQKRGGLQAVNLSDLRPVFPPEVASGPDTMVGYAEILPFEAGMGFRHGGLQWVVDEQYCIEPSCTCRAVVLTFVPISEDGTSAIDEQGEYPVARYDYKDQTVESLQGPPSGWSTPGELVTAVRAKHPQIESTFRHHHEQLRTLFQHHMKRRGPQQVRKENKVGRNEPCPCGSGKKHKKCCYGTSA